MKRRSFLARLFAALLATSLARELTAAEIPAQPPALSPHGCPDCRVTLEEDVFENGKFMGTFYMVQQCERCAAETARILREDAELGYIRRWPGGFRLPDCDDEAPF